MQRDFERDDPRRRYRQDDDPRDDPRERYGNEEDAWSREYRRAYAEGDLPRRMHDDRPYDRPGYEPEVGRPGGRPNVESDRSQQRRFYETRQTGDPYGYDWEQPARQSGRSAGYGRGDNSWQGGFYGQGQRFEGEPFRRGGSSERDDRRQPGRTERYGQPSYGRAASPYGEGDTGPWYGGDTGMGDPGSSQYPSAPGNQSRRQYGDAPGTRFWQQYGEQIGSESGRSFGDRDRFRGDNPRTHGPFAGRGPRGYQRSDERIREDVCELLTHHGEIDASSMEVEVSRATVTLRGTADSGRIRRLVEELIEDVPGVRDVQNELRVNQRTGYAASHFDPTDASGRSAERRGGSGESSVPAYGVGVAETSGVSTRAGPGEPGASAGAGPSQHGNRWQIRDTMDVVGSDGETVGTVKAVHGTDFHLDRPVARDVFVPFSAVQTVDGERVMLRVRANEVDDQNWPAPDLMGSTEGPAMR